MDRDLTTQALLPAYITNLKKLESRIMNHLYELYRVAQAYMDNGPCHNKKQQQHAIRVGFGELLWPKPQMSTGLDMVIQKVCAVALDNKHRTALCYKSYAVW